MIRKSLIATWILALPVCAALAQDTPPIDAAASTPEDPAVAKTAQLEKELARLEAMKSELQAMETTPLPPPVKEPAPPSAQNDLATALEKLPKTPVSGSEEAFADTLYRLGQFARAHEVYKAISEAKTASGNGSAWIGFQLGNCARETGDFVAAIAAYETVMNVMPDGPWAHEAEWWSGHLKWRLVWNETMKNNAATTSTQAQ